MSAWILYGLLAGLSAAFVAIFGKLGVKGLDSTLATTVRAGIMFAFLVIVSVALKKTQLLPTLDRRALVWIAASGVAGALSWLWYFLALKTGPVKGVTALDRLSVVFAILLAALFLGEGFGWRTALGMLLVGSGALLLVL
ncbi:MAG: putative membrane protein [Parcubacteria group bacterium Gr01-1014_38]|nr:MAG: putative membrane protein [Parcubacteria group bacterium Gr01-1014_38]